MEKITPQPFGMNACFFFNAHPHILRDRNALGHFMEELPAEVGMNVLSYDIFDHIFLTDLDDPFIAVVLPGQLPDDPGGVTTGILLCTSHAMLHTWPDKWGGWAFLEISTCRPEALDLKRIMEFARKMLGAKDFRYFTMPWLTPENTPRIGEH